MALEVIAAVHLCLDLIPRMPQTAARGAGVADLLRPGAPIETGRMTVGAGGPVCTTGFAKKIFGAKAGFMAWVGDEIGRTTLKMAERYGSAECIRVAPGEGSSYSVVLAPPGIDRIFLPSIEEAFFVVFPGEYLR